MSNVPQKLGIERASGHLPQVFDIPDDLIRIVWLVVLPIGAHPHVAGGDVVFPAEPLDDDEEIAPDPSLGQSERQRRMTEMQVEISEPVRLRPASQKPEQKLLRGGE